MTDATPETVKVLAEHRAPLPGRHDLVEVRVLDADEVTEIQQAVGLVSTIAASTAFAKVQELTMQATQTISSVSARARPSAQEIDTCKAAVAALVQLHGEFIRSTEGFMARAADPAAALAALRELNRSPSWRVLGRLADGDAELVRNPSDVVGVGGSHESFESLADAVTRAFMESQHTYTLALVAYEAEVLEAARRLRRLYLECAGGWPALLDLARDASDSLSELKPQDIPLQLADEATRLTQVARLILDGEVSASTLAAEHSEQPESRERDAAGDVPTDPASADQEVEPPQDVVDLEGLVRLASALNDDLEQAWSGGLERALHEEGIAKQMAAVRAAAKGLRSHVRGVRVPAGGPDAKLLKQWEDSPEVTTELVVFAQMSVLASLLSGLSAVAQPSTVQLKFDREGPQELNRFWQSGAFAQLRGRFELLESLLREQKQAPEAAPIGEAIRHLALASRAWFSGDPESCVFHAGCALAAIHGCGIGELGPHLAEIPAARVALRALESTLAGKSALPLVSITAPVIADVAGDLIRPGDEQPISGRQLFDLLSDGVPYSRLTNG